MSPPSLVSTDGKTEAQKQSHIPTLPKLAEVTQLGSELGSLWPHSVEDRWLTFPVKTSNSETSVPSVSNTLLRHS